MEKNTKLKCKEWNPGTETFVFKAQQNLIFAELARTQGRFDIEANRMYYALHQLACELVRQNKMTVSNPGDRATPADPWRIKHGSYGREIRETLGVDHADRTVSGWHGLRQRADYDPEQVCRTENWKHSIKRLRERAYEVAEAMYEKLSQ